MREFIQNLSEISEQICKFAAVLKNKNIKRTQIFLSDMEEFKIAFFGAMLAGTKPELLRDNHFEDGFFGIDDEKFAEICAGFENLSEFGELNLNGSEIFYLKTSGSTGKPKNIQKSLLDMVLEAKHLAKALNLSSQEQFLASVTHQNMFGLTFKFFLPLVLGAKSDGGEYNYPEIIFDQSLNGSILISSPTILNALYQHKNAKKIENLKMIISAGARLPQNLRSELNKITKAKIVDIYGSSETGVVGANLGVGLKKFEPANLEVGKKGELIITSPWCKRFESSDSGRLEAMILFCTDGLIGLSNLAKTA
ncbi:AMP-binding protein [Campylobacter sp. VBCF_02 NA5]|uniref:AMP-binding protein n=1 Tax=Campylobacter sp. VBCF_02 NA5 TaxID=2983834 RepID=UPI0022E9C209|nr:AMP-binding protein [Campylobacter sp. VBCF_02 NA5]MDA3061318.1 AMP-binding protein [Campylobacter sp. VBCF_02 NA5]